MIVRPALFAHEFFPVVTPYAPGEFRVVPGLEDAWRACESLGMVSALSLPRVPRSIVPGSRADLPYGLVAGCTRPGEDAGIYQAVAYDAGDLFGLVCVLAPEDSYTFPELEREWLAARGSVSGAGFGVTTVLAGLHQEEPTGVGPDRLAEAAASDLGLDANAPWVRTYHRTSAGFLVWELPSTGDGRRRLLALAPAEREPDFDAYLWSAGGGVLGPFPRYLSHVARLRYQEQVFSRDWGPVRRAGAACEAAIDVLARDSRHGIAATSATEVAVLEVALDTVRTTSDEAATALSRTRRLGRTVVIAAANLSRIEAIDPARPSALTADQALGTWLEERVEDEIAYLQAVVDRAEHLHGLTVNVVQSRIRDYQQQLALLQTSLLGGLVAVLAAVQAFGYRPPVPQELQPSLIVFLGSFVAAIPVLVLGWSKAVSRDRLMQRALLVLPALLGASSGWLLGAIIDGLLGHGATSAWIQAGSATTGAVLGLSIAVMRLRSLLQSSTQEVIRRG